MRIAFLKHIRTNADGVVLPINGQEFRIMRRADGTFGVPREVKEIPEIPVEPRKDSQNGRILAFLRKRRKTGATLPELMSLSVATVHSRITDLRQKGWNITMRELPSIKNRFGTRSRRTMYFLND